MTNWFKLFKTTYKKTVKVTSYLYKLLKPKNIPKPYSKKAIDWLKYRSQLDGVYIQHAENGGEFCIPGTKFKADGYIPATKTVLEHNGCYHHGCIRCYNRKDYNQICKKTMEELYNKTMEREKIIKKLGYKMIVIWEHEWDEIVKKGENKISWFRWTIGIIKRWL